MFIVNLAVVFLNVGIHELGHIFAHSLYGIPVHIWSDSSGLHTTDLTVFQIRDTYGSFAAYFSTGMGMVFQTIAILFTIRVGHRILIRYVKPRLTGREYRLVKFEFWAYCLLLFVFNLLWGGLTDLNVIDRLTTN